MNFEYLKSLKEQNRTLRILNSDHFALSMSFFHMAFIKRKIVSIEQRQIEQWMDDYLFEINERYPDMFVKNAKAYLEDFSDEKHGFLRRYHGSEGEVVFELTPYVHKALEFVESLEKREFVGSHSKFTIIFELLEKLEFETSLSDEERIEALQRQKSEIDEKIEAIQLKRDLRFDDSRIKEHYMQIIEIAQRLTYDFTEMEYKFKELNTHAMEKISTHEDAKSDVLVSIFDIEESIRQSDQGKSFFAFWQLLTDPNKSDKLSEMIEKIYQIDAVVQLDPEQRLSDLKYALLQNAEKVYGVSSKLIEQLRRFLDDRVWVENRRILELSKSIEQMALAIKEMPPVQRNFMEIAGDRVSIDSIFEKRLYQPKKERSFSHEVQPTEIDGIELYELYNQFFVDEEALGRNIDTILMQQSQCSLSDIVNLYSVHKGIGEIIGYLSLAKTRSGVMVDEEKIESIEIIDFEGNAKRIRLPKIIFTKER